MHERVPREAEVGGQQRKDLVEAPVSYRRVDAGTWQVEKDEQCSADRDQRPQAKRKQPHAGGQQRRDAMQRQEVRQGDRNRARDHHRRFGADHSGPPAASLDLVRAARELVQFPWRKIVDEVDQRRSPIERATYSASSTFGR